MAVAEGAALGCGSPSLQRHLLLDFGLVVLIYK